jgi:tetratricopeptide (TPR) repeat protein
MIRRIAQWFGLGRTGRRDRREGDLLLFRTDGQWVVLKVLRIDRIPVSEGGDIYHCLSYQPARTKPRLAEVRCLEVRVWHSPVASESLDGAVELLGHACVKADELRGFLEYLKHTDVPRYYRESGQDVEKVIRDANLFYREGCRLADDGDFEEAIEAFTRAVELFPPFYEALDNRGLARMDLGDFHGALVDFDQSLRVHGNNPVALFSRGECLCRLGEFRDAVALFEECATRWPENGLYLRWAVKTRIHLGALSLS